MAKMVEVLKHLTGMQVGVVQAKKLHFYFIYFLIIIKRPKKKKKKNMKRQTNRGNSCDELDYQVLSTTLHVI